jgi:hypothetical protein
MQPPPHWFGATAPHTWGGGHVPQFSVPPHLSAIVPQFAPSTWQVVGTHPPPPCGPGEPAAEPDSSGFGVRAPPSSIGKRSSALVPEQPLRNALLPTTTMNVGAPQRSRARAWPWSHGGSTWLCGTALDLCRPCNDTIASPRSCGFKSSHDMGLRTWLAPWPWSCALVVSRYTDL